MRRRKEALMTTLLRKLLPSVRELDEQYPVAKQSKYQRSDCVLSVLSVFVFKQSNLFRFEKKLAHPIAGLPVGETFISIAGDSE